MYENNVCILSRPAVGKEKVPGSNPGGGTIYRICIFNGKFSFEFKFDLPSGSLAENIYTFEFTPIAQIQRCIYFLLAAGRKENAPGSNPGGGTMYKRSG